VIHAAPERVFAYVTEPSLLPEWLPSMVEVRNVVGTGAGQQYEWTYKMAGLLLRGQSTVVEYVPNQCAVLHIEVEYSVPVPVLGKLAERLAVSRDARDFALAFDKVKETLENQPQVAVDEFERSPQSA